ncbi:MAG: bifunctional heptose 7-phosphate kinase/heptose 1-phosphate adenyltransferase [Aggregatilineales bacterium]
MTLLDSTTLQKIIPNMANQRVLVAGDVILDEYIIGSTERLSREAPIPVLELREKRYIPGGAANPAANIVAFGSDVLQAGVIGADSAADTLKTALSERGINTDLLIACDDRPTTVKTRIMAQMGLRFPQQVARVDTISRDAISTEIEQRLLKNVRDNRHGLNAMLFSDYHGGLLTSALVTALRDMALKNGIFLSADAQGSLEKYAGFHLVKCNADDAADYLKRDLVTDDDFASAATLLYKKLDLQGAMVITRGANGATVAQENTILHCPAPKVRDVFDTVGAGDTAIAIMTLAHLANATIQEAVMLANVASGIVVQHVGNYCPTPDELSAAL